MKIFIVNGYPGSGKTLFQEYCYSILHEKFSHCVILRTSVIDPVKAIARMIGWDGDKDERGRKFLSDLKDALDAYSNFTFNSIDAFADSDVDFIFMDARSDYDIDYAVTRYDAITVFIDKKINEEEFSNHADANVRDYNYQYYIDNNGTKEDFYNATNLFLYEIMNK